jgi:SPX domain protein involved in polyphosphate accumulation
MKYTHVLKYNSVPEWREHYINYPLLKKILADSHTRESEGSYYGRPQQAQAQPSFTDEESSRAPLLLSPHSIATRSASLSHQSRSERDNPERDFLELLDSELAKIIRFYLKKEAEISAKYEELSMTVQHAEGIPSPHLQQAAGQSSFAVRLASNRMCVWSL